MLSTPVANMNNYLNEMNSKILEKFEILDYIGSGSESKVFKVKEKKSNKMVTMKMINKQKGDKNNLNEYIISHKLKHMNIIDYYGGFEIKKGELDCMLIEYAKFGNLREFQKNIIQKDYFSESLLCFITYQILKGLEYIHKCKIAHLDLKPQNIVINDYLNVKIIDFSVSLNYSKIKKKEIKLPLVGTSFYMAPEIVWNKTIKVEDFNKVDLFSLGVILYNFAFGEYPFGLDYDDRKNIEVISEKYKKKLEINNEGDYYSSCFIDFLKNLLETDINKRIDINQALNDYWVKGAKLLNDEKENIFFAENFLRYLITEHYKSFDDYIKKKSNIVKNS